MKLLDVIWGLGTLAVLYFVYQQTDSNVAVAVLTAFAAIWNVALQFRITKTKEANARLFSQKAEAYQDLIKLLSDMFQQLKKGQGVDMDAASDRFVRIRTNLIIWGSAKTIRALDNLSGPASAGDEPKALIDRLSKLYAAIRQDLGHSDGLLDAREIALGHVIQEERHLLR